MKTKSINEMEAQYRRLAKRVFDCDEITETWLDRLTGCLAALYRYRNNAYKYIRKLRIQRSPEYCLDEKVIRIPADIYTKPTK